MPTLWDVVTSNSTAPSGSTFWEHLNAQASGGVAGDVYVSKLVHIQDTSHLRTVADRSTVVTVSSSELVVRHLQNKILTLNVKETAKSRRL